MVNKNFGRKVICGLHTTTIHNFKLRSLKVTITESYESKVENQPGGNQLI